MSCVIGVGWSINWLYWELSQISSSFCVLQSGDVIPTLQFGSPIMSTSIWYESSFYNASSNLFIISVVDLGGLYQVHTVNEMVLLSVSTLAYWSVPCYHPGGQWDAYNLIYREGHTSVISLFFIFYFFIILFFLFFLFRTHKQLQYITFTIHYR